MKNLKIILYTILFFTFISSVYSQSGWQILNPSPTYMGYDNIKMLNDNTGIAIGYPNIISKTTNGGETWALKSRNLPVEVNGYGVRFELINFINSATGFISGTFTAKTTDAGETWNILEPVFTHPVTSLKFINENTGFIFSTGFYKTTNSGLSWTNIFADIMMPPDPNQNAYLDFVDANTGCIAAENGVILKTVNGGLNWNRVMDSNSVNSFNGIILSGSNAMAVTKKGKVFKSADFGNSWSVSGTTPNLSPLAYSYITILSENSIIVTQDNGATGNFFRTTNSGDSWEKLNAGTPNIINDFDESPNGNIFQVTWGGLIYKSTNSGDSWICKTSSLGDIKNLSDVKFINANTGFISGEKGLILKTTNSGQSFSKTYLNNDNSVTSIDFVESTGYAAISPVLYKTTNMGETWFIPSADPITIVTMKFTDNRTGIAAASTPANGAGVYKTIDGGLTWSKTLSGGFTSSLYMINSNEGFYYYMNSISFPHGQQNVTKLYKTNDGGDTWEYITILNNLYTGAFGFINSLTGFITSPVHNIYKTTDGGHFWTETPYSSYCSKLQFINQLTGYAGPGLKTTNGGESWFQQNCNAGAFDYVNEDIGFAAGGYGAIMKTTDGGGMPLGVQTISSTAEGYSLSQNYPNPFNPETKIQFSLPKNGIVRIVVYDLLGREVKELVNEFRQQGSYNVSFNGTNFSSGIYFYKLITDDFVETKKMILVK